jgi:hypothetical protein
MGSIRNWMLGAAVLAGVAGLGAGRAQAAEFRVFARGPVAYVPPCPGPGYAWIAGYRANGYWVPGRWAFHGPVARGYVGFGHGPVYARHFYRGHERFRR